MCISPLYGFLYNSLVLEVFFFFASLCCPINTSIDEWTVVAIFGFRLEE